MKDLSASAFKCWLIMAMSKDKFILDYSPEYISSVAGISKTTCRRAMIELKEKGYLIQYDIKNYNFFEYPHFTERKDIEIVNDEVREILDPDTGEVFNYTYSQLRQFVNEDKANKLW